MTFNELLIEVLKILPGAVLRHDHEEGQLVIYTNLVEKLGEEQLIESEFKVE